MICVSLNPPSKSCFVSLFLLTSRVLSSFTTLAKALDNFSSSFLSFVSKALKKTAVGNVVSLYLIWLSLSQSVNEVSSSVDLVIAQISPAPTLSIAVKLFPEIMLRPEILIVLFISLYFVNIISYYILNLRPLHKEVLGIAGIILVYIIMGILTYNPPFNYIFLDTVENKYGINIYEVWLKILETFWW